MKSCTHTHFSGVGTVVAVAALATKLFKPQINIHNLLYVTSLIPWEQGQAQAASSLHQSHTVTYMHTILLRVQYKVIKILVVGDG